MAAALREVREELGLVRTHRLIIDAGERREVLRLPGMLDRELVRTVFARSEQPLEDYRIGPEVAALIAIGLDDADALFAGGRSVARCPARTPSGAGIARTKAGEGLQPRSRTELATGAT